VDEVPVQPQRDPAAGQIWADLEPVAGQAGGTVAVHGPVNLDHGPSGQGTGPGGGGRCGRWPGWGGAAYRQRGQVFGVQAGWGGPGELAVDEHVHGELVGPHVGELPARAGPSLIGCTAGSTPSTPLAEITVPDSTAPADCAPISTGAGPGWAAASGAGRGDGTTAAGVSSGWEPGRNRLAGVAMSIAWWGR
jgi:hypothetical protein